MLKASISQSYFQFASPLGGTLLLILQKSNFSYLQLD